MSIEIDLTIVEPIELEIQLQPSYHVGVKQAGPKGDKGDKGDTGNQATSLWEADGLTTIKPLDSKTVDADYISGTVYGGLFQP